MALQSSVGPWPLFSFLILDTVARTPWKEDILYLAKLNISIDLYCVNSTRSFNTANERQVLGNNPEPVPSEINSYNLTLRPAAQSSNWTFLQEVSSQRFVHFLSPTFEPEAEPNVVS
jgi:hypothetical protein